MQVLDIVTSLTGAESISPTASLVDLGIDSLSSTALVDELGEKTGLQLSRTLIFEHSTAAATADHVVQMAGGTGDGPGLFAGVSSSEAAALSVEGCYGHFPGGASSVDELRCFSSCGRDAVGRVPVQRWKVDSSSEFDAALHAASLVRSRLLSASGIGFKRKTYTYTCVFLRQSSLAVDHAADKTAGTSPPAPQAEERSFFFDCDSTHRLCFWDALAKQEANPHCPSHRMLS